jgi:hypothetical protein
MAANLPGGDAATQMRRWDYVCQLLAASLLAVRATNLKYIKLYIIIGYIIFIPALP